MFDPRQDALDRRIKAAERHQEALVLQYAAMLAVMKEAAEEPQEDEESDG